MVPTVGVTGLDCKLTVYGTLGTKRTAVARCATPMVAVIVTVPTDVQLMCESATPLVVVTGESSVPVNAPGDLVKVTGVLAAGLPYRSETVTVNTLPTPACGRGF